MTLRSLILLAFYEYFDEPNSLVIIEWASRASQVLPKPDYHIDIIRHLDDKRVVTLMGLEEV